jgi:hypothetical protein
MQNFGRKANIPIVRNIPVHCVSFLTTFSPQITYHILWILLPSGVNNPAAPAAQLLQSLGYNSNISYLLCHINPL